MKRINVGATEVLNNVFFEKGSADLKEESKIELEKLTRLIKDNPGLRVQINGHTDNIGTPEFNMELSEKRAEAVYAFLVKKHVHKYRLEYKGFGETKPVATNDTEAGRAKNRRTELEVLDFD